MKKISFKDIDFKQPKYILPAIIYIPILVTGYFIIDMFQLEVKEPVQNSTAYLNPELPEAQVGKMRSREDYMSENFEDIHDETAVDEIDKDTVKAKDQYKSTYGKQEQEVVNRNAAEMEALRAMQARARKVREEQEQRKKEEERRKMSKDDYVIPISQEERQRARNARMREDQAELDRILARTRNKALAGQTVNGVTYDDEGNPLGDDEDETVAGAARSSRKKGSRNSNGSSDVEYDNGITSAAKQMASAHTPKSQPGVPDAGSETEVVVKKTAGDSQYFSTVSQNDPEEALISAIIDENIKAKDGSRVRLRLLDDVTIGTTVIPKGTYLYATMSGFSSQRVSGKVGSVFANGQIRKISLTIYDTDGLEGLYVPESSFRETAREIGGSALSQSVQLDGSSSTGSLSNWVRSATQQASSRVSQAISKAIRKNTVKLKYGTKVYLVNGSPEQLRTQTSSNRDREAPHNK